MDVSAIRDLLSQGETGQTLDALTALLEPEKRFKNNLLRTVRLCTAQYHKVRAKEHLTISSAEARLEYGRINEKLFDVLDDLEAGRIPTSGGMARFGRFWPVGGAMIVAFLAWQFWPTRIDTAAQSAWQYANQAHTLPAYRDFLAQYSTDPLAVTARDSLASVQKSLDYWLQTAEANIIGEEPVEALKALERARQLDPRNPEIIRLTNRLSE